LTANTLPIGLCRAVATGVQLTRSVECQITSPGEVANGVNVM